MSLTYTSSSTTKLLLQKYFSNKESTQLLKCIECSGSIELGTVGSLDISKGNTLVWWVWYVVGT